MTDLFAESYADTEEGRARMRLSQVALVVGRRMVPLDPDERMHLVVLMHRIVRDDLPEDLRPLYDEFRTHLDMK